KTGGPNHIKVVVILWRSDRRRQFIPRIILPTRGSSGASMEEQKGSMLVGLAAAAVFLGWGSGPRDRITRRISPVRSGLRSAISFSPRCLHRLLPRLLGYGGEVLISNDRRTRSYSVSSERLACREFSCEPGERYGGVFI